MAENSVEIVYVAESVIRQRFNELDYYGQLRRGELTAVLYREHLASASSGQPPGTLSQFFRYKRGDVEVARVHQYRLRDGTLGASGLPDPKWLRDGNRILIVARANNPVA
jgi:hypothetical protein